MDNLFGVSMTGIMIVLVTLLAISLATVGYVIVRNRIMFFIGLRNIPRRPAQTVLIIVGLMLSTLIISAAFTTGDTVDYSLGAQSYNLLGHVDEMVQRQGESENAPTKIDSVISQSTVNQLRSALQLGDGSAIDGFLPVLFEQVPAINPRSRQSEPSVNFAGLEAGSLAGFPDLVSAKTGDVLDVAPLGPDEAYMDETAADKLDTQVGDSVQVFVAGQPHTFKIVDIVKDRMLAGVGDFNAAAGMTTRLDTLQQVFGKPGQVSFIVVSNRGGVRDGLALTSTVVKEIDQAYAATGLGATLHTYDVKRDLTHRSEQAGNFMATFFIIFGLFSIAAGMLLIVMIFVMLAAERKSELGMARAVGTKRGHLVQMFLSEGMAYNMVSALVGAALGVVVAIVIARVMARIFAGFNLSIQPHVTARSLVISYSLGVVLTFLTVIFASWRVSNLNIVRAIRDIPEPAGRRMGRRWLFVSIVGIVIGALLFYLGLQSNLAFPLALGFTVLAAGAAVLLRYLGLRERPVFSAMGTLLLLLWGLTAGNRLEFLFGKLKGGPEMFFLSGIAMVTAATFIMIYNADLLLVVLSRLGGAFGRSLPAIKTAVAYPLASKFRTGMTLAMISLVIFALTMMSVMNLNFDRLFLADNARGGWDVTADENPNNPIPDLSAALRAAGSTAPDSFRAVGKMELASEGRVGNAGQATSTYPVIGVDAGFIDGGRVPLSGRAKGFESDAAVWQALKTRQDVAVVDHFTAGGGGGINFGGDNITLKGIKPDDKAFDPVTITVRNAVSGATTDLQVIGVIDFGASASFFGIYIPEPAFQTVFGQPMLTRHLIGLQDPGQAKATAREIEASLLSSGVQAESLKATIDKGQRVTRNFFLLMQSFAGLGLFVGIAAVGVIAFRTVVERRQQIGMLRAIGYQRSTVALSFLLESSFIALLGIAAGVGLAIWLSYFLITSDEFPSAGAGYAIPWLRILLISAFAFIASLVMTYIPARQAASVPIAEALRYE